MKKKKILKNNLIFKIMNKYIVIILAFLFTSVTYAQKKELKFAERNIKSEDYSAAKQNIQLAEKLASQMDAKTTIKYHYLKGVANYANGGSNIAESSVALENLNKAIDLESTSSTKVYTPKAKELRIAMLNRFVEDSRNGIENNDLKSAYLNLEMSYRVSPNDTLYLYNAALVATENKDFDQALSFYNELIDLDFTGITTNYYAIEKATGEEQGFQSPEQRELFIKAGTHENPTDVEQESVEMNVFRSMAAIYKNKKDYERSLGFIEKAKNINEDDINIVLLESNIRWEMGDVESYEKLITRAIKIEPDNVDLHFNLGVISSDKGDVDKAMYHYNNAIEVDSTYTKAHLNAAALVLQKEQSIIEEMNSLGTSNADYNRYDELKIVREDLYKSAIPYLESVYRFDNNNLSAVRTLRNIYSAVDDMDNYKKFKAIAEDIESKID
jgi:tetratricopeptide (TPR) repeat protein